MSVMLEIPLQSLLGENEKCVDQAIKMLRVEYEVLPANLDPRKAMDKDTPLVHPEDNWKALCNIGADNKKNLCATEETHEGDVDAVLADCDVVVEHTYHTKANQQAMMETFRTYTYMDAYGRLNIVSSTQVPFHVRRILGNALDIPKHKIRVIKPRIGGGFGGKTDVGFGDLSGACYMENRKTGKDYLHKRRVSDRFVTSPRNGNPCSFRSG